ncbi:MAG: DUF2933 domain-containing protein [Chloroflexi bacterium]|nr:DUF2933 domain-containing protein [Chloroflexota bacterium]
MATASRSEVGSFLRSRTGLVLAAFLGIAGFLLVMEHTAHRFGALPYLLLLACPLLHLFLHGGHADHGDGHHQGAGGVRQ